MREDNNIREANKSDKRSKLFKIQWSLKVNEYGYSFIEAKTKKEAKEEFEKAGRIENIETRDIISCKIENIEEVKI